MQLLPDPTLVSDVRLAKAKSSYSMGLSFWSNWSHEKLLRPVWCLRCLMTRYFHFFFQYQTYVWNFSIALLPNSIVFKEFYLRNDEQHVGLQQSIVCSVSFDCKFICIRDWVSMTFKSRFYLVFVQMFWFQWSATMVMQLNSVYKRTAAVVGTCLLDFLQGKPSMLSTISSNFYRYKTLF